MGRIILLIAGLFLMSLSLALLWGASIAGNATLASAGLAQANYKPSDVFLVFIATFIAGYVFVVGTFLQNFFDVLVSALTGGHNLSREQARRSSHEGWDLGPKVIFGGFTYLLITVLYGAVLQLFVIPDSQGLSRFLDLEFVKHTLAWPYWWCAALNVYGIPFNAF
ncbi:MAG: hypothetical protein EXR51_11490 [Dehalococcoidia bacterium]|nr:hypothetical protein [Dehalococcoidia bacterium]